MSDSEDCRDCNKVELEGRLSTMEASLSKIMDNCVKNTGILEDLRIISAVQTEQLKEHMRRTELLENEIKPLKKHVSLVEGAMKLFTLLATLAGLIFGFLKLTQ